MTDLARAFGARAEALAIRISSAWSSFGNVRPSRPSPPTLRACRREKVVAWNPAQAKECFGGVILALAAFILQINDGPKPKSIRPFSIRILSRGKGERERLGRTRRRLAGGIWLPSGPSNIFLPLSEDKRRFSPNPDPRSSVKQMNKVLRSLKSLACPFIRSERPPLQRARPKSRFVRASLDPTACAAGRGISRAAG